ncbi:MAG: hypothetical protein AAGJ52_02215 [Pseudomonadota bacterium]
MERFSIHIDQQLTLKLLCALCLLAGLVAQAPPVAAQPSFQTFLVSSDIEARVPAPNTPGFFQGRDRDVFSLQPVGTGTTDLISVLVNRAGVDLDSLHDGPATGPLYSIDTAIELFSSLARPGDVFSVTGGALNLLFDARAAGVPDGVDLDAVSYNLEEDELIVSFDRFFLDPNLGFIAPGDLITVVDGDLSSLLFDGPAVLPDGVNVDGAHWIDNQYLLLSFDIDTLVPGPVGQTFISDDDIALYDRSAETFTSLLDLSTVNASWDGADIDALAAILLTDQIFSDRFQE